jgi:hypothetical protein
MPMNMIATLAKLHPPARAEILACSAFQDVGRIVTSL